MKSQNLIICIVVTLCFNSFITKAAPINSSQVMTYKDTAELRINAEAFRKATFSFTKFTNSYVINMASMRNDFAASGAKGLRVANGSLANGISTANKKIIIKFLNTTGATISNQLQGKFYTQSNTGLCASGCEIFSYNAFTNSTTASLENQSTCMTYQNNYFGSSTNNGIANGYDNVLSLNIPEDAMNSLKNYDIIKIYYATIAGKRVVYAVGGNANAAGLMQLDFSNFYKVDDTNFCPPRCD
jgi:hypothetical protein